MFSRPKDGAGTSSRELAGCTNIVETGETKMNCSVQCVLLWEFGVFCVMLR